MSTRSDMKITYSKIKLYIKLSKLSTSQSALDLRTNFDIFQLEALDYAISTVLSMYSHVILLDHLCLIRMLANSKMNKILRS